MALCRKPLTLSQIGQTGEWSQTVIGNKNLFSIDLLSKIKVMVLWHWLLMKSSRVVWCGSIYTDISIARLICCTPITECGCQERQRYVRHWAQTTILLRWCVTFPSWVILDWLNKTRVFDGAGELIQCLSSLLEKLHSYNNNNISSSYITLLLCSKSLCSGGCLTLWDSCYSTATIPAGTACCVGPYGLRQPQIVLRHRS